MASLIYNRNDATSSSNYKMLKSSTARSSWNTQVRGEELLHAARRADDLCGVYMMPNQHAFGRAPNTSPVANSSFASSFTLVDPSPSIRRASSFIAATNVPWPTVSVRDRRHSLAGRLSRASVRLRRRVPSLGRRVSLTSPGTLLTKIMSITQNQNSERQFDCVACQSPIKDVPIQLVCGHSYDSKCLINHVELSTRDESLFPPRCCSENIPLRILERHMESPLAAVYHQRQAEYSTRKRVYCANGRCSRFLGALLPGSDEATYACPACTTITCAHCRSPVHQHTRHRCKQDRNQRQVLALAQEKGWASCPACGHLIELHSGCYHVKCKCKAEFCYLCTARWKTCHCAQFEQLPRAELNELDTGDTLTIDLPPLSPPRLVVTPPEIDVGEDDDWGAETADVPRSSWFSGDFNINKDLPPPPPIEMDDDAETLIDEPLDIPLSTLDAQTFEALLRGLFAQRDRDKGSLSEGVLLLLRGLLAQEYRKPLPSLPPMDLHSPVHVEF